MSKTSLLCGQGLHRWSTRVLVVRPNMSSTPRIELPYFSVAMGNYLMICICCGITGTKRAVKNPVDGRELPKISELCRKTRCHQEENKRQWYRQILQIKIKINYFCRNELKKFASCCCGELGRNKMGKPVEYTGWKIDWKETEMYTKNK